jgi:hypothetical protein
MPPGQVDITGLMAKMRGRYTQVKLGDGCVVIDRIALRKSWARKGQATYWVDLVHSRNEDLYQVFRLWQWTDRKKTPHELVAGMTPVGDPNPNKGLLIREFIEAVENKLGCGDNGGYVVDSRLRTPESPVAEIYTFTQGVVCETAVVADAEPPPPPREPLPKRRARFDVF